MKKSDEINQNLTTKIEENNGTSVGKNEGTINIGCSVFEVKEICTTIVENKINEYKLDALACVNNRIDSFSQSVYSNMLKMGVDISTLKEKLSDPALQFDFRKAEIEYAKKGTDELKSMLSNILITKIKNNSNELLDLVLSEAIEIAPKLLLKHIRTISLSFILTRTRWQNIASPNDFYELIKSYIIPLLPNISDKTSDYLHLSYTGVAELHDFSHTFLGGWNSNYAGLFSKGFLINHGDPIETIYQKCPGVFIKCFNDESKYQFAFLTIEDLVENLKGNLLESEIDICKKLFKNTLMNEQEMKNLLLEKIPEIKQLFDYWEKDISRLTVTSVGIVLSIQYLMQLFGIEYDYSNWI